MNTPNVRVIVGDSRYQILWQDGWKLDLHPFTFVDGLGHRLHYDHPSLRWAIRIGRLDLRKYVKP